MSLICVACGKTIVMSSNPNHLGCCAACGNAGLTEEQKKRIEDSSSSFRKKER
jgi:hypothetical protein